MENCNNIRFDIQWTKNLKKRNPDRNLEEEIQALERKVETELKIILNQLDMQASVKSEPYSLPYQKEICRKTGFASIKTNIGSFDYTHVFRPIVKQLLNEDVKKMRFYFYIQGSDWDNLKCTKTICFDSPKLFGSRKLEFKIPEELPHIIYKFRYSIDKIYLPDERPEER